MNTNIKRNYPVGKKFMTVTNHITGEDGPDKWEEVTVTGHWNNKVEHEAGIYIQLPDGATSEISYAYLNEDGSGH